jgi:hypothetical protein
MEAGGYQRGFTCFWITEKEPHLGQVHDECTWLSGPRQDPGGGNGDGRSHGGHERIEPRVRGRDLVESEVVLARHLDEGLVGQDGAEADGADDLHLAAVSRWAAVGGLDGLAGGRGGDGRDGLLALRHGGHVGAAPTDRGEDEPGSEA